MRRTTGGNFSAGKIILGAILVSAFILVMNAGFIAKYGGKKPAEEKTTALKLAKNASVSLQKMPFKEIQSNFDVVRNRYVRSWTVTKIHDRKFVNIIVAWPQQTGKNQIGISTIIHPDRSGFQTDTVNQAGTDVTTD